MLDWYISNCWKLYFRTNYLEFNIEEDIDLKNQFRNKNLPEPISSRELYVDNNFNDTSVIKNTAHVDFNDKNLDNFRFVKVDSMPELGEHLTAKNYVDQTFFDTVDKSSLLRLDSNGKLKIDEQESIFLNSTLTSPKTIIEKPTKSNVNSLQENGWNRWDLSSVFNDQDNEFDDIK